MKKYYALIILVLLVSCRSKSVVAEAKATDRLAAEKIIKSHYNSDRNFKTIAISASARYRDSKQSQNVTAEIKIKKDEKILVSVRFLGITMAKALITPKEVKYYEKLNGKYFEGDYTMLSKWLGTDLDFVKVQNMLIGQALDDLTKRVYKTSIEDKLYKLESSDNGTDKSFYFEAARFLIKKQEISQSSRARTLRLSYPNHVDYPQMIMPGAFLVEASDGGDRTTINIEYNKVTFDEDMSFPYNAPGDYERILID